MAKARTSLPPPPAPKPVAPLPAPALTTLPAPSAEARTVPLLVTFRIVRGSVRLDSGLVLGAGETFSVAPHDAPLWDARDTVKRV